MSIQGLEGRPPQLAGFPLCSPQRAGVPLRAEDAQRRPRRSLPVLLWAVSWHWGRICYPLPPAVPRTEEEAGGASGTCLPHRGASLAPPSPGMVSRWVLPWTLGSLTPLGANVGVVLAPGSELTPGVRLLGGLPVALWNVRERPGSFPRRGLERAVQGQAAALGRSVDVHHLKQILARSLSLWSNHSGRPCGATGHRTPQGEPAATSRSG